MSASTRTLLESNDFGRTLCEIISHLVQLSACFAATRAPTPRELKGRHAGDATRTYLYAALR